MLEDPTQLFPSHPIVAEKQKQGHSEGENAANICQAQCSAVQ